jgi:putative chitinase
VLLEDPFLLSDDFETAVRSGTWFWWANGLNRFADADDIVKVTRKINGGRNGLAGRQTYYERAAYAYGLRS